jgi:dihydroorotate dehydrogenase electron transfer subunit
MSITMATGEALGHKKYGEHYHSLSIVVPKIAERVSPGQFVNVRCGEGRANILRRPFSVSRMHRTAGRPSTIEIVFDVRGPGSAFLASRRSHDMLDVVGPAGRGFVLPNRPTHCLLVGGGIGAAPLFLLADELRERGHQVDVLLGARSADLLLSPMEARRLSTNYVATTEDGSTGETGRVTDVLIETIDRCGSEIAYACGPQAMLGAVSRMCVEHGVPVQVAVEELMACGYGVCMTCVMPLRSSARSGSDGVVYARSCTEGPVFDGAHVVWNGGSPPVEAGTPAAMAMASRGVEHPPPGN